MAELIQVGKQLELTLPRSVRDELGIREGVFLEVQVRNGEAVLRPQKITDKGQGWFWTAGWQQSEKEAEADIKSSRLQRFADPSKAVNFLKKESKRKSAKNNKEAEADVKGNRLQKFADPSKAVNILKKESKKKSAKNKKEVK